MSPAINLRAERINRGLSLRAAAKVIEVSVPTLARAEQGATPHSHSESRTRLHPANALKIAKFYGYKPTDIWPIEEAAAA